MRMTIRLLVVAGVLGAAGILLAAFGSSATHRVTLTEGTNVAATIAPDGSRIIMDLQGALWSLPAAGGAAMRLTDPFLEPARPDWAPTGDSVAFESYAGGTFHIWIMRPDGSGVRQLTFGHGDDRDPRLSPDGTRIAFSSDRAFEAFQPGAAATAGAIQRTAEPSEETKGSAKKFWWHDPEEMIEDEHR